MSSRTAIACPYHLARQPQIPRDRLDVVIGGDTVVRLRSIEAVLAYFHAADFRLAETTDRFESDRLLKVAADAIKQIGHERGRPSHDLAPGVRSAGLVGAAVADMKPIGLDRYRPGAERGEG